MDRSLPTNYKWHVVAMLWCISFFNYADRQAIFSVFPLLEREMQLTSVQLGLLGSAFAWVYGLGAPFAGWIVDRVKRRSAILGGLYAWSAICIATIFSWDFKHLLFWRAAEGLGETFYYPASMSLVSDYHDSRTRSRAMGLHQTSVYIGTIGGGFFAGLIGQYYGWRLSFIVFGGLGILLGLVLQRHLVEPPRGAADLAEAGGHGHAVAGRLRFGEFLRLVGRTPTLLCLMGAFMCANFVAVVLLSWMPKFLYDRFHMGLAMAGLTATVFVQVASMVGAPLGGWLADAWRRRSPRGRLAVQMVGVLGGAPFVVLCGMTQSIGVADRRADAVGALQGSLRREHLRVGLRRRAPGGARRGGGVHEHDRLAGRRRHGAAGDRPPRRGPRPRHGDRAGVDRLSGRWRAAADRDRVLRHTRRRAIAAGAGGALNWFETTQRGTAEPEGCGCASMRASCASA